MQTIPRILIKNLIFSASLALISYILFKTVLTSFALPVFWALLIIFALITVFVHLILIKLTNLNASKFFTRFFLITGIKMIFLLAFIIIYSFLYPHQAVTFLISFLALYLLYSVFEVIVIIPFFKGKTNK